MPKKVRTLRRVTTGDDVEVLLDRFETALIDVDREQIEATSQRLWELSDGSSLPAEAITRRLIEGASQAPAMAFNMLEIVAGEQTPIYLLQIFDNRNAPDLTRFAAARRYGWPQRGEAKLRREFLDSLSDPDGTLVLAVRVATQSPLTDGEVLEEVLGYLTALPSERRLAVVRRIVEEIGRPALRLFHALLHVKDTPLQREVLTHLASWREPGSIGPVERLAATARTKAVKAEAEKALVRLRLRDVTVGPDGVEVGKPLPPVFAAYLSLIDGDGGQIAVVIREMAEGLNAFLNVFSNEAFGIKDTIGKQTVPAELVDEMMEDFQIADLELIEVEPSAVRGAMVRAAEVNAATKKTIPPAYEIWEPLLHDAEPPPMDEETVFPELDDANYAGRDDLLNDSDELLDHLWFDAWGFPYEAMFQAMIQTPVPSRGRLTDRQIKPLVEHFMTPVMCATLRSRLRRQAWLLDRAGDTTERDQALAVAASLVDTSPDRLVRNRFVRKLIRVSVEAAAEMFYWGE
jgi:hypothetical protein